MSLKTEVFVNYVFNESFRDTLNDVNNADASLFEGVVKQFEAEDPRLTLINLKELSQEFDAKPTDVKKVYQSIESLINVFVKVQDAKIEDIISDLNELDSDFVRELEHLEERLSTIKSVSKLLLIERQKEETASLGGSMLKHMTGVVVVKPIINERYTFFHSEIEEYDPKVDDFTTLVQLELSLMNDVSFNFQATEKVLNYLINDLIALKKEVISTKNKLNK